MKILATIGAFFASFTPAQLIICGCATAAVVVGAIIAIIKIRKNRRARKAEAIRNKAPLWPTIKDDVPEYTIRETFGSISNFIDVNKKKGSIKRKAKKNCAKDKVQSAIKWLKLLNEYNYYNFETWGQIDDFMKGTVEYRGYQKFYHDFEDSLTDVFVRVKPIGYVEPYDNQSPFTDEQWDDFSIRRKNGLISDDELRMLGIRIDEYPDDGIDYENINTFEEYEEAQHAQFAKWKMENGHTDVPPAQPVSNQNQFNRPEPEMPTANRPEERTSTVNAFKNLATGNA